MNAHCGCGAEGVLILPCSGGSNCGQIANAVASELDRQGYGKFYCLAGIGAHIPKMVETTGAASRRLVIDGCGVACGRKALELARLSVTDYLDVEAAGIVKSHSFRLEQAQVELIAERARSLLNLPLS
jgi:uncharacterized metal-binding protein